VKQLISASVIEASLDAIVSVDEEGRIILWNPAAESMFGYTRQEAIGQPVTILMCEKDRNTHLTYMKHFLKTGKSHRMVGRMTEVQGLRKDGSTFNKEMSMAAEKIDGSWVFTAIMRDISERKQAEEKQKQVERNLQHQLIEMEDARRAMLYILEDMNETSVRVEQAKQEWEATFDAVTDPVFLHDAEGNIMRANRAYAEHADMSVEEVIGKPYWQLFPLLDGPLVSCVKALEKAEEKEAEEEIRLKSDETYLSHSYAIRSEGGAYRYSIHFLENITERKQAADRLRRSLEGTIRAIASAVEARDPYTSGHQRRVADLATVIAREMGLKKGQIEGIHMGATIHDIGKIQLPAEMLSKPSKLTDIEYSLIQGHSQVGCDILKDIEFPWPVADIAYQHHERVDGSGYPQGLKGEEICLEARIVAVADVVMASHRPYRPGLGIDKALAEIRRGRGSSYDAGAADACLRLFAENRFSFE
jgi:PAS domain S-box-containing protein/putative nucleotidyltransferase with HDIG domain